MTRITYLVLFLCGLHFFAFQPALIQAQVPGVDVSVTPRDGSMDSSFEILVTVDPRHIRSTPELAASDDFSVVGSSTRSQTFISNGEITRQYAYSFSLLPQRAGTLQAPDVLVEYNGRTTTIDSGSISVSKSSSANQLLEETDMVFRQSVDSLSVYQGQQVRSVFEILSEEPFRDIEFPAPAFPGFWVEAREEDRSGSRMQSNRRLFYFQTTRTLFPVEAGLHELAPQAVTMKVRDTRAENSRFRLDPFSFGSFFEHRAPRKVTLESNPVSIAVSPLPAPPAGASFWGVAPLVGSTSLTLQFSKAPIDVSESKSIHVVIETTGNANPLKQLPLDANEDDYRIYQETPQISYSTVAGLLRMRVTFSASIVPARPGAISIPPLRLTYFNPQSKEYEVAASEPVSFSVTGSLQPKQQPAAELDALPLASVEPSHSGLPVYRAPSLFDSLSERISAGLLIFIAIVLTVLTSIVWLAIPLIRHRRYYNRMRSAIADASSPNAIWQSIEKHIQRMTGIKTRGLQNAELAQELSHYISNKDLLFSVQHLLDLLDHARFKQNGSADLSELRTHALRIITAWR